MLSASEHAFESEREKITERARKDRERHAYEYGCDGLLPGVAKSESRGIVISASQARREDGPFYCQKCFSDVVLRKCTEMIDHYAHHARLSPAVGRGESELHQQCKNEILAALRELYPDGKWEKERTFPANPKKRLKERRPDLSGYIGTWAVVIEIQASALTIPQVLARTKEYSFRQCHVLWIVPLKEDLGTDPFIPRLYERYFQSIYRQRTYYWRPGDGAMVLPVHYGIASRYIDQSSWFEDGEEQTAGGYFRDYVLVKTPVAGRAVEISPRDFSAMKRSEHVPWNVKKAVPQCRILQDRERRWWNALDERKRQPSYYRNDEADGPDD